MTSTTVTISVRDSGGLPLDTPALVKLRGSMDNTYRTASTQDAGAAVFEGIPQGEYEAEAKCVGYETGTEHVSVTGYGAILQVYVYLLRESESKPDEKKPQGLMMAPKLQAEIEKGLEALHKHQFESARLHFAKGSQLAPGNPDVVYLQGVAELGLNQNDLARKDFEHALSLDPGHERALLALGEEQLRAGEIAAAIANLEKAFQINGAGWRTNFLLASAYAKAGRLAEAEARAEHAAALAHNKGAIALLLLGEIQQQEGKRADARRSWQQLIANFPDDSAAEEAKRDLAAPTAVISPNKPPTAGELASLPVPALPSLDLAPPAERPWAPPDIDSKEYPMAQGASCSVDEILPRAEHRLELQLQNFEKFAATEHIEHQEIDRYGRPGPVRARDFSYIVFVQRFEKNSFFLQEQRDSRGPDDSFPTSLATVGLNNLGVAVLQPANRKDFHFLCEGLSNVRGRAAWQIRFEERKESHGSVREWKRNGQIYGIPLKGRMWISSAGFDIVRVETDLREPVVPLGLTRDHLLVDYGPVKFISSNITLWLPESAEMFMELHGHRYHHKHYLTDYMLFEVDTNHRIGKPKDAPPPAADAARNPVPASR
jgi:Flp pilus assembly protein TadD